MVGYCCCHCHHHHYFGSQNVRPEVSRLIPTSGSTLDQDQLESQKGLLQKAEDISIQKSGSEQRHNLRNNKMSVVSQLFRKILALHWSIASTEMRGQQNGTSVLGIQLASQSFPLAQGEMQSILLFSFFKCLHTVSKPECYLSSLISNYPVPHSVCFSTHCPPDCP